MWEKVGTDRKFTYFHRSSKLGNVPSVPGFPPKEIHSRPVTSDLAASAEFVHDYPSRSEQIERGQAREKQRKAIPEREARS
jgi:hypothetical protein